MLHIYRYRFLVLLRNRSQLFWSLLFPLILGTFFFVALYNLSENIEALKTIPVAVVRQQENETNEVFEQVLKELEKGDTPVVSLKFTGEKQAEKLLREGKTAGTFLLGEEISLQVSREGMSQSILKEISSQYLSTQSMVATLSKEHPEMIEQSVEDILSSVSLNQEITFTKGTIKNEIQYFYALMAMVSLYACFFGLNNAISIQANLSAIAARRNVTPTHKMKMLIGDFLAAATVQLLLVGIVLFYLIGVLGVDFGGQLRWIILTCVVGSLTGVSYGLFVGTVFRISKNAKFGLLTAVTLVLCFLSGLMVSGMKDVIEHYAPVINRINPAALITDALYCLNIYDDYSRFTRNIVSLVILTVLLCAGSFLVVRRERYADI